MTSISGVLFLHDARLAPLALSALPAWLWSADAAQILWANPTGAAIFGAPNSAAIAARKFYTGQPAPAQIAQMAATLVENAPPQIERLRGFGAGVGRALACACSRVALDDGTPAILVVAAERAGPDLPLNERIARLFAGIETPLAIFTPEGKLIHATLAADAHLQGEHSLAALGVAAAASDALRTGHANGTTARGPVVIHRLSAEDASVLVADFAPAPRDDNAASASKSAEAGPAIAGEEAVTPPAAALEASAAQAEAETSSSTQAPPAPTLSTPPPAVATTATRRYPLRFVWRMDEDGRFTIEGDEFITLIGPQAAAPLGRSWLEVSAELGLDPEQRVAQAVATRDTWSGLTVAWPVDGDDGRLTIELSGLPVFDRERIFRGYRGFGVCRDLAQLSALAKLRGAVAPAAAGNATAAAPAEPPAPPPPASAGADEPNEPASVPVLSAVEHHAFHELSRRLTQRLNEVDRGVADSDLPHFDESEPFVVAAHDVRTMFDRLPLGVLIYRLDRLLYANAAFLDAVGHRSLDALTDAGGLDSLMVMPVSNNVDEASGKPMALTIERADRDALDAELIRIDWEGEMAHALVTKATTEMPAVAAAPVSAASAPAPPPADAGAAAEAAELRAILDTATDGVIILDFAGQVLSGNRSAEALFGYDTLAGKSFLDLFAPESIDVASAYLDNLREGSAASMLNAGREVMGRVRQGGLVPLFMTLSYVGEASGKLCAVFRDITQWKKTEEELIAAKRVAETASSAKSDFLAKISHEIRTPLNAIIGFSEVMMEERFGPVGSERYRGYLKDIHTSGGHLISLINDLLDLSKIEAGKLEMTFASVSLNDLTQQCVAIMQPQANRDRVIIRTALAPKLPKVLADARSVRQIVLNLLSNSIKFTTAGGQVIVSTALKDDGEVALRVRDTGVGMSEQDIVTALEPFRQVATVTHAGGTGLGLPLTKALAEANQASFRIKSAPKEGTLVEIAFSASQVLAD